jgi:hypothetical protein
MMTMIPILKTNLGEVYEADCIRFLKTVEDETLDLAFAEPLCPRRVALSQKNVASYLGKETYSTESVNS